MLRLSYINLFKKCRRSRYTLFVLTTFHIKLNVIAELVDGIHSRGVSLLLVNFSSSFFRPQRASIAVLFSEEKGIIMALAG